MSKIAKKLFSGIGVGCLGFVLFGIGGFKEELDLPLGSLWSEIGVVMMLCGFSWALMVRHLKPFPFHGLGIGFAILFVLIIPSADEMEFITIVTLWPYLIWVAVCLAILTAILVNMYRKAREEEQRYIQLLKTERIEAGKDPITGERL